MAETLGQLGSERAWLVHGSDGTDELTITGHELGRRAGGGRHGPRGTELHPEAAGLPVHPFEAILGGTPEDNARAFRAARGRAGRLSRRRAAERRRRACHRRQGDGLPRWRAEMARESLDSGAAKAQGRGAGQGDIGGRMSTPTILDKIRAYKLEEIAAAKADVSQPEMEARRAAPPVRPSPRRFCRPASRASA